MQQTDCEVDTGAGCNILLLYKVREIFKQQQLSLDQPTVYIQAFGGQTVRNLGFMHGLHAHKRQNSQSWVQSY